MVPIRPDGECFRCHVGGIGFTFTGGGQYGRQHWNTTRREFMAEHVGERRDDVERAS